MPRCASSAPRSSNAAETALPEQAVPRSRYAVFFSIAISGCLADLLTKHLAFAWLGPPPGPTRWLIPDVFGFQTSTNRGALFGFGQGWVLGFAALSCVALIAILYWLFRRRAAEDLFLTTALAFVSAGILGNLYDRLGLHGLQEGDGARLFAVRDWILMVIFGRHWPNYNLADSFLVCGAALLVWHSFRSCEKTSPRAQTG
jgi:signal peptidase II